MTLFVVLGLMIFCDHVEALQQIERITGLDRSFVAGYSLREQGEIAHGEQVLEFTEEGESAIYAEGEEKEQEEDLWFYIRKLDGGILYNSNDKNRAHDPLDDITYTFIPTLIMSRKSQNTSIELGYQMTASRKAVDEEASTIGHLLFGAMSYHFEKFDIALNESFAPRSVLEQGERTELVTDNVSRSSVFAFTNNLDLAFNYSLSQKIRASFTYKNHTLFFPSTTQDLTNNTSLSEMDHSYNPSVSYQLTPKVRLFTQYTRQVNDFFKDGGFDSRSHIILAGADTKILRATSVKVSGGYFSRDYQLFGTPDTTGGLYKVGLSRALTKKVTASLYATNEIGENLGETASPSLKTETQVYGASLTYALTPHTSLISSASATFLFRSGQVTQKDPENSTRTLTRPNDKEGYQWGVGVAWNPRRPFSAFFGYDFENKKAPFENQESTAHRVAATATYVF